MVTSRGSLYEGLDLGLLICAELAEHHGSCYCWNGFHKKCEPFSAGVVIRLLLILAGDVEENPGPFGMYFILQVVH